MIELRGATLTTLAVLIQTGQHSSVEVTEAYLARIDKYNPALNAYLKVFEAEALAAAKEADDEIAAERVRGPLHGVPIAVKDIIDVAGHATTAGGILLSDEPAREDAEVIARLRNAGAVILGKLNLHEYAWGGTTDNPHYGRCFNPWKEGHSPGGSSGGSGAAVAADLCAAALGTDTLGSVRIPSSYCGCVGIKPTAGRVSNRGVYPLSWSLDNVGPLAMRVQDALAVLNALAGYDSGDAYSVQDPFESISVEDRPKMKGLRVGVPNDWVRDGADSPEEKAVLEAFSAAVDVLVNLGCETVDLDTPNLAGSMQAAFRIALADAAAIHKEHMEKNPDKIGDDVCQLLEMGANLPGTDVAEAFHEGTLVRHRMAAVMEKVDCLVTPTTPAPAHAFDAGSARNVAKFTGPYNLLGYPAVSLPCGFTEDGLPIGLMIAAAPFQEAKALQVAQAYEAATDWKDRLPEGFD